MAQWSSVIPGPRLRGVRFESEPPHLRIEAPQPTRSAFTIKGHRSASLYRRLGAPFVPKILAVASHPTQISVCTTPLPSEKRKGVGLRPLRKNQVSWHYTPRKTLCTLCPPFQVCNRGGMVKVARPCNIKAYQALASAFK
jgi:hypothetical protein